MAGKKARAKLKKVKKLQQNHGTEADSPTVKAASVVRNNSDVSASKESVCPHHSRRRARHTPRGNRIRQRQHQRPVSGRDPSKDAILLTTFDGVTVLADPNRLWMLPSQITMPHIMKHTSEDSPRLPGVKDIGSALSVDTHLLQSKSSVQRAKKPWEMTKSERVQCNLKKAAFNVACAFVLELKFLAFEVMAAKRCNQPT
jgi:hypothetical protein